jgi:alkaline phosphatase D
MKKFVYPPVNSGYLLVFIFSFLSFLVQGQTVPPVLKIAFGSCGHQDKPQPILAQAAELKPDFFIFLGDNIYGDTKNMDTLKAKYQRLGARPEFQKLLLSTKVLATWDDHDFGENDAGRHYPMKEKSKQIFLDFWKKPKDSERRKHKGIYHSYLHTIGNLSVQIIMLDVRTFRDNVKLAEPKLRKHLGKTFFYDLDYLPEINPDSTLLGAEQWKWLENQLKEVSDIKLICSGTQFGISFNGYESWANFPQEQSKMAKLIQKTRANGVVFLSGDVHYGEISKINFPNLYPIYDFTSSGITSRWDFATPNENRIEGPVMENHFGLLSIFNEKEPLLRMEIWDVAQNQRVEYSVKLSEISFK